MTAADKPRSGPGEPALSFSHDAFISYSHFDRGFAARLRQALAARGKVVWQDESGILPAERWRPALVRAIESADAFVFVMTPHSAASAECRAELDYAFRLNKRVIPVAASGVSRSTLPPQLGDFQFIPPRETFDDDFAACADLLVQAIDTDLDWVREHTQWALKALEWDGHRRDASFLLAGSELDAAEPDLRLGRGHRKAPGDLHQTAGQSGQLRRREPEVQLRRHLLLNEIRGPAPPPRMFDEQMGGAISPDDRYVVTTAGWDNDAHVYQIGQPGEVMTLQGHSDGIDDAVFSPDGTLIATAAGHSVCTGEVIAALCDNSTRVWDIQQSAPLLSLLNDGGTRVDFSSDGTTLAVNTLVPYEVGSPLNGPTPPEDQFPYDTLACLVCGGFGRLVLLAEHAETRQFTPAERAEFLHA
jgi:hypothetical protein